MLPTEVLQAINAAWVIAREDRAHVLPYNARFRIWEAMGPRRRPGESPSDAHVRRTRLAMACASRALPVWDRRWPDRKTPRHALAAAEESLSLPARWERYIRVALACEVEVEAVMFEDFASGYAGESAVAALRVAIYDESDLDDAVDEGDVQVGGPVNDAAGNAVTALANGTSKNPNSDPTRRLEFWRWYLAEAIPSVYDADPVPLD